MSKKKRPVILGPDGKPYVAPRSDGMPYTFTTTLPAEPATGVIGLMQRLIAAEPSARVGPKKETLASAVAAQVAALTATFDGETREEMPKPEPDLHTYVDALASARKKCQHPHPESTTYSKGEWFCPDCERYFGPEEYQRTRTGLGRWFS
jgi:hypothetical protein